MKGFASRVATAAMLVAIVAGSAAAQQDTTKKMQDTTRKESKGEVATMPTFASLITALDNTKATVDKLGGLTGLTPAAVTIVDANTLVHSSNQAQFDSALTRNDADLKALGPALDKVEVIVKGLSEHQNKIKSEDVVAVDVTPDNHVIVYYRKKP